MERIIFYIISVLMIVFAAMTVSNKNIMRSIIYLLFVLIGMAAIYFMIEFYFLGAVQLTVYAGGIIVLYVNSVMLVEKINNPLPSVALWRRLLAGFLSAFGIILTLFAVWSYDFAVVAENQAKEISIEDVGLTLLSYGDHGYILPFEVISVLLLAAMVGAIVIAKTNKHEQITNK
ncbi:MAG: NADH-quinone oxidoreductase subunit J [Bacteroidales bacterium]|nr:NADH-quinone oxidoreductase subunit J [Bacteroidales bacterium]